MLKALDDLCGLAAGYELDVTLAVRGSGAELGLVVTREARRRGVPSLRRYAPLCEVSGSRVVGAAEMLLADLKKAPPGHDSRASGGRS